jgi:hypothetical protein
LWDMIAQRYTTGVSNAGPVRKNLAKPVSLAVTHASTPMSPTEQAIKSSEKKLGSEDACIRTGKRLVASADACMDVVLFLVTQPWRPPEAEGVSVDADQPLPDDQ